MEKTFRGKVTTLQVQPVVERMASRPEDVPWPCIAGPNMPDTDPKLWKKPRLDMNSSLAFLRRELAAMQLQDRAIHKQLLKLNSAILGLKTTLNESWELDDKSETETESEIEAVCYPAETSSAVTKVEVTVNSRTQVSHAKQDSGILTDEESGDEENDVFESEQPVKARPLRVRSVSVINLPSYHSSLDIDINNNKRTQSAHGNSNTNSFQAFNLSVPRSRSYTSTEGQFHRVTSMPVINENPNQDSTISKVKGKAFAIYGYANEDNHASNNSHVRGFPLNFKPLSWHESMPTISGYGEQRRAHHRSNTEPVQFQRGRFNSSFSGHSPQPSKVTVIKASSQMDLRRVDQQTEERIVHHHRSQTEPVQFQRGRFNGSFSGHTTQPSDVTVIKASSQMDLRRVEQQTEERIVHHHRSQTEPVQFQRGRFNSSFSGHTTQPSDIPVMRASSQMDLRRIDQQTVKPYRIYRTSSQVSLV